jgi:antitoxin HicB
MLAYPIELVPDDNDTLRVAFPDVPEANSFGDDEEDAKRHAVDALETALAAYVMARRPIPSPSPARGRPTVTPSLLGTLKIELYRAMLAAGLRKADLARRLRLDPRQVDRLLDLTHESRTEQLEAALAALGKRVTINIRGAA